MSNKRSLVQRVVVKSAVKAGSLTINHNAKRL
jgi:hypothetical protein